MIEQKMTIDNIKDGAVRELLNAALSEIAFDAMNVNTEAEATRRVVLTITVKPSDDRQSAVIEAKVIKRFAPHRPITSVSFIGYDQGEPAMFERNRNQTNLFANATIEEVKGAQ